MFVNTVFIIILIKMTKVWKKYKESKKLLKKNKAYSIAEAAELVKKVSYAKFDSTVELAIKTNANPKYNDQLIRATTVLPHGTGKSKKIAVFASEDKHAEIKAAWADIVGYKDLLEKIKAWNIDFDVLITSAEYIRELASVAKSLGPKGLMPSPKAGTVTANINQTVEEFKKGKMEFKLDKTWNIHIPIGKTSFDAKQLEENITEFLKVLDNHRPSGVKWKLIRKITISPTMGPGIQIEQIS